MQPYSNDGSNPPNNHYRANQHNRAPNSNYPTENDPSYYRGAPNMGQQPMHLPHYPPNKNNSNQDFPPNNTRPYQGNMPYNPPFQQNLSYGGIESQRGPGSYFQEPSNKNANFMPGPVVEGTVASTTGTSSVLGVKPQQSNAEVINYIKSKCFHYSNQDIEKMLLQGEFFNDIKGEGTDVDTSFMEEILKDNDFYEKPSQKLMREETMKFVRHIVDEWSTEIARNEMRISLDEVANYTAKLLPFGSYVLDLKSNSSDIDLICVCPGFIKRDTHFFQDLASRIQKNPDVKNFSKVVNARVPIVTFVYKETDVDISYCQLESETIPRDIEKVISSELVETIKDDRSKTAILGRKNNLMILELTKGQLENFKQTLRVVKVWAKNRGISSNGMGFLGGISWAILVAKICQIFPHHKPYKLLGQFFKIYSFWNWKSMPVNIMKPGDEKFSNYMMCVVTPGSAYNSTERVNEITFRAINEEIHRGSELIMANRPLDEICRKSDFFNEYPIFIEIDVCGKNETKQQEKDYKEFQGNVTSKVLILLTKFVLYNREALSEGSLRVVPNPNFYKKNDPIYGICNAFFMGIKLRKDRKSQADISKAVIDWCMVINKARGDKKDHLNVRVFQGRKEDFTDVEIAEHSKKKKEEKEDPRLAMRRAAKMGR